MTKPDKEWERFRQSMLRLALIMAVAAGWGIGIMQSAFGIDAVWAGPFFMLAMAWITWPDLRRARAMARQTCTCPPGEGRDPRTCSSGWHPR